MADNRLKSIAIVGASGNVGASTLKHLLDVNPDVKITIVTRAESAATFPSSPQVTVKKGSYDDSAFLRSAFQGVELAMFALSYMSGGVSAQSGLIEAAARAGVRWIVPNEYGGDGLNENMATNVPVFHDKIVTRKHIERLAKVHKGLKWIGVVTNPWTELSLETGLFGFNIPGRKATLYEGSGPFNSSSMDQVGRGIAHLLSLPITNPKDPQASLEHYANNFVYISSFSITQAKLFDSILRATGTSEQDWTISRPSIEGWIQDCTEKFKGGDFFAGAGLTYAYYMGQGLGGDIEVKAAKDRVVLGLKEENLDEVVRGALAEPGKYTF